MKTIYESAAETAKKVRKALKEEFPGMKFSVRSRSYSMGSAVDVSWIDGPTSSQVNKILSQFQSASFDGMQDLKSYTGYMYEGQLYNGADYVMGQRELSKEYRHKVEDFGKTIFGDWQATNYQMNEAEAELNGNFPYNRMNNERVAR